MKKVINGVYFDTEKCERLASHDSRSNNNYSGTTYLLRANNGTLLVWNDTNGQDGYNRDFLILFEATEYTIDDFQDLIASPKRLVELGLITIDE
jgi:hypothetical protein